MSLRIKKKKLFFIGLKKKKLKKIKNSFCFFFLIKLNLMQSAIVFTRKNATEKGRNKK